MSDTVLLNPATSTGAIIATDQATDGSSAHYQLVKAVWGVLDSFNIVSSSLPFPVLVTNNPSTIFTVANPTTAVSAIIGNTSATAIYVLSTGVTVANPTTAVSVAASSLAPIWALSTGVTIANPTTAVSVAASSLAPVWTLSTGVTVANPTTAVSALVTNTSATAIWVRSTDVTITNPTTAVSAAITNNRSATADSIQSPDPLDRLYLGTGSSYAPQFASIAVSSSGNNTIVTNTGAGIKVTVLSMAILGKTGGDFYLQDGASTVLFGSSNAMASVSSQGGFVLPYNPKGWFKTGSSANLILHNLNGSTLSGSVTYALSS